MLLSPVLQSNFRYAHKILENGISRVVFIRRRRKVCIRLSVSVSPKSDTMCHSLLSPNSQSSGKHKFQRKRRHTPHRILVTYSAFSFETTSMIRIDDLDGNSGRCHCYKFRNFEGRRNRLIFLYSISFQISSDRILLWLSWCLLWVLMFAVQIGSRRGLLPSPFTWSACLWCWISGCKVP